MLAFYTPTLFDGKPTSFRLFLQMALGLGKVWKGDGPKTGSTTARGNPPAAHPAYNAPNRSLTLWEAWKPLRETIAFHVIKWFAADK
jgi:hypothetical protein